MHAQKSTAEFCSSALMTFIWATETWSPDYTPRVLPKIHLLKLLLY